MAVESRDLYLTAADGLRLHAVAYGAPSHRPAVVCLPGLTRTARDFDRVAPALAEHRLVVALDLRGRGGSDRDGTGDSYALEVYVDDVRTAIDELTTGRVVLVGTSLGGLVSLWLAAAAPEQIAGVVLGDIGPDLQDEGLERIRSYAGKLPPVESWAAAAAQCREIGADAFPDFTDADWDRAARQRYVATAGRGPVLDYDPAVAATRFPQTDPWLVFAGASEVPMLLVRGALTDLLAPDTVEQMQAFHPGLEVVEVPLRGHAPTFEEPEAAAALQRFVDSVQA